MMIIDLIRITITAWTPILQISFSLLRTLTWDSDAATPVHQDDQHEHDDDHHEHDDDLHDIHQYWDLIHHHDHPAE